MRAGFFDPFSLEGGRGRYARLASFRHDGGHAYGPSPIPGAGEAVYLFSHAGISEALKHARLMQSPPGAYQAIRASLLENPLFEILAHSMLFSDPPRHGDLRRPLVRLFTPAAINALERDLRHRARTLADTCMAKEQFDIVQDFAIPFVVGGLAVVLGFPIIDPWRLKYCTSHVARLLDLRVSGTFDGWREVRDELTQMVESALASGDVRAASVAGAMLELREEGSWSHDDVVTNLVFLLFAGQETVVDAIGNAVVALHEHPHERELLRTTQIPTSQAVEELLRYSPPLHFAVARIASDDVSVAGVDVRAGQSVVAVLASGNRDEAVFPDGDRLRLERVAGIASTFGTGLHICLGQHMARLEMAIALETLYRHMPQWHLQHEAVGYRDTRVFHGPVRAPAMFASADS